MPIVLADLEQRSRKDVAAVMKLPEGTVSSRLATGRKMLADRLGRRGLTLPAGLIATLVAHSAAHAYVSAALLATTLTTTMLNAGGAVAVSSNVVALAEGVMKSMLLSKLKKLVAAIIIACPMVIGLGLAWRNGQASAGDRSTALIGQKGGGQQSKNNKAANNHSNSNQFNKNENNSNQLGGKPKDKGEDTVKKFTLGSFSKIHLNQGKAVIRCTRKQSVEAKGNPILVGMVKAVVKKGTLFLQAPNPAMTFTLEVKDLTSLKIASVGQVVVKEVKAKRLEIDVGTVARVSIFGEVNEQIVKVAAAGQYDGAACRAEHVSVTVASGARAMVYLTGKLKAVVAAGGRVEYIGSPEIEGQVSRGGRLGPFVPPEPKK